MTLKVIGFKEYVYICISLHSVGREVLRGKISERKEEKKKKGLNVLREALRSLEALYLTKVQTKCIQCFQIRPNCRPLLTRSSLSA